MTRRLARSERGAALVEFAMVLPLLLVLLFGIMEAGWLFAQQVEVRNAAREGGRLAVVDYPTPGSGDSTLIVAEVCSRAVLSAPRAEVLISKNLNTVANPDDDSAVVTVTQQFASLTGFLPWFNNLTISSTAEMRLERETVTWTDIVPGDVERRCP
jgi:Flp pilus assembly protein TadG